MPEKALIKRAKADSDAFEWTPEREKALEMFLAGVPKTQIAKEVGVHRNTINAWTANPAFLAEARQRNNDHVGTTRQRRMIETNLLNNKIAKIASKAVDRVATSMEKGEIVGETFGREMRVFREVLFEFRSMREEERKDFGDDIKRIETRGQLLVGGDIDHHHSIDAASFRDFLKTSLDEGVIDAEILEDVPDAMLLHKAVEHALVEGSLLDAIDEEDKAAEVAARASEKRK